MKIGRSLLTQKTKAIAKTILNHLYVTKNNILVTRIPSDSGAKKSRSSSDKVLQNFTVA
jgi:ribosomal protein S24E